MFDKIKDKLTKKAKENSRKGNWKMPEPEQQLFVMHIPKTGGTTFRKILYNHVEDSHIWPSEQKLKDLGSRYPKKIGIINDHPEALKYPIVMGHYSYHFASHLSEQTKILAFFRSPLERTLSHVKHLCANDEKYQNDPNLVVEDRLEHISLLQSKIMGYKATPKGLKEVKQNMNNLNFVGITEEFDKSLKLCNKIFNWKLKNIEPQNVRSNDLLHQLSAKNRSNIVEILVPEIKTYNLAKKRFNALCKKHLDQ